MPLNILKMHKKNLFIADKPIYLFIHYCGTEMVVSGSTFCAPRQLARKSLRL